MELEDKIVIIIFLVVWFFVNGLTTLILAIAFLWLIIMIKWWFDPMNVTGEDW